MQIVPGTRLGSYEIVSTLGAGGMGEVYRGRDLRLDRQVAIKVLPDLFAADPDRLARFDREAKTLASLNHPNIAQLHGIEESGDARALIMELVEGETLAERIARGALPLDEALPIARQIADALEAAHGAGIVHRDLKPANIKVRPDGTVKVLDFGLAKVMEPATETSAALAHSPTFTSPAVTRIGVILGTAAYMAPEQARGLPADTRADIWAFGVVLYEMLTGQPLFQGSGVSDVIAAVLRDGPKWDALPSDTPASVRRLLRRCLQKDPRARLRHAGDASLELTDVDARAADLTAAPSRRTWPALLGAALAAAAIPSAVAVWLWTRDGAPERPLRKWIIAQESGEDFFGRENMAAISPDGQRVAYTDGERLHIRELSALESRTIPGVGVAGFPTWSPDGSAVAFFIDHKSLWRVAPTGANPTKIADLPAGLILGMAWRRDGTIVLNIAWGPRAGRLFVVPEGGGRVERFATSDDDSVPIFYLRGLPDGSVTYKRVIGNTAETILKRPDGREQVVRVAPRNAGVNYSPSGHLVYTLPDTPGVFAKAFDLASGETSGEPFRIAEAGVGASVSNDGTLAFGRGVPGLRQLTRFDRDGTMRGGVGQPQENIVSPAMSPDGTRIAVSGVEGGRTNVWIHEVTRPVKAPVTFIDGALEPAWHPSDGRLLFQSGNWDLMSVSREGGAPAVIAATADPEYGGTWSSDGAFLVFGRFTAQTLGGIWILDRGQTEPRVLFDGQSNEIEPTLSPDGRYVAYVSDETGRNEIWVRALSGGTGKIQVSNGGGSDPLWSPKGNEVFYVEGHALMSAPVRTAPALAVEPARRLFELEVRAGSFPSYTTHDGQQFFIVRTLKPPRNGIAVVQSWFSEFRR